MNRRTSAWAAAHAPTGTRWGRKTLALLLSLVLCLSLLPAAALAADAGTDITGEGTAENPYLIYTADGLKTFRDIVNGQNGQTQNSRAHANLMKDIVLNDGTFDSYGNWSEGENPDTWTPIGIFDKSDSSKSIPYTGTFDGGGHTIKGIYVPGGNITSAGLFGCASGATIKNVAVTGFLYGHEMAGGIVGLVYGSATITNCINHATVRAMIYAGGIIGSCMKAEEQADQQVILTGCFNTGVMGKGTVGGLVSSSWVNIRITDCGNIGELQFSDDCGGIICDVQTGVTAAITNCYSAGKTTKGDSLARSGGLVGYVDCDYDENPLAEVAVTNSYWLKEEGSPEYAIGFPGSTPEGAEAKTEEDFSDGTVLELLKGNGTDSLWGECGYLEAAGMVVPLLKGQAADSMDITGEGTAENPYLIYTAAGLKTFRDIVNGQNGQTQNSRAHAKLMKDIVLNDGTFDEDGEYSNGTPDAWTPIGNADKHYSGTFNGNGKTIKGLYVTGEQAYAGLFGFTEGATIKNVTVDGYVSASGNNEVWFPCTGGIVGAANDTHIENCTNLSIVKSDFTNDGGSNYVGGIAGNLNGGTISNCRNSGKVILELYNSGYFSAGGIVGCSGGQVISCCNTGAVTTNSKNNAQVRSLHVGGVVGQNGTGAQVKSCYNTGAVKVTGNYTVAQDANTVGFGGVVGVSGGTVSKCYNTGNVTCDNDNANVGGVAGVNYDATVTDCYFLKDTATEGVGKTVETGTTTNIEGKTKAEFADGTVLGLLKNGEENSPWTTCGYLEAAKMTLPLLNWQTADDHTHSVQTGICTEGIKCACGYEMYEPTSGHDWGDWAQDDGKDTHTRKCQTEGCAGSETEACADSNNDGRCDVCGRVLRRTSRPSLPSYTVTVEKSTNGSVSADRKTASPGAAVTITVTPDRGYTLETLTVTDRNGNEQKLTNKGGGKYTFAMPSSEVTVRATFMDDNTMLNFFVDVKASDYYYDAVLWAAQTGVTAGTDAVHFSPDQPCTRAQIVTFLWRAAGSPLVNYAMNMTDVSEDAYYAEAVRWALSEGVATGTTATTFSPDETCTRAQAVAFLFRYAAPEAVTLQELVSGFSDAAAVPGYALGAMNWALAGGIVQGDGSRLLPNDSCTRAQIVTFLYRTLAK